MRIQRILREYHKLFNEFVWQISSIRVQFAVFAL